MKGLYVITEEHSTRGTPLIEAVTKALEGGARWVQYRDKTRDHHRRIREARALRELCCHFKAGFVINDDLELAIESQADGLHIGADDIPLSEARAQIGLNAIIGVSCYNRIDLASIAARDGADYLAFGSVYPSPTKPDAPRAKLQLLREAKKLQRPVCAIGGINLENASSVRASGADLIAVVSTVFGARDIRKAAQALSTLFESD
ncbi:thiamine phosphate synthase [Acidihalobacter prosperus]